MTKIKSAKKMKNAKVFIMMCLCSLLLLCQAVPARAQEAKDSAENADTQDAASFNKLTDESTKIAGIHVYTLPAGEDGYQEGDSSIWIYTEYIDNSGEAVIEDDWKASCKMAYAAAADNSLDSASETDSQADADAAAAGTDAEGGESAGTDADTSADTSAETSDHTYDIPMNRSDYGFYSENIASVTDAQSNQWTIVVTIKDGNGEKIGEYTGKLNETMLSWPVLAKDSWEETYKANETIDAPTMAISVDWDAKSLFKRIFSYNISGNDGKNADKLDPQEYTGPSILYNLTASGQVKADLVIGFKDLAGNTSENPYHVAIKKEALPIWIPVLGAAAILLALAAGGFVLKSKGIGRRNKSGKGRNGEHHNRRMPEDIFCNKNPRLITARNNYTQYYRIYLNAHREWLAEKQLLAEMITENEEVIQRLQLRTEVTEQSRLGMSADKFDKEVRKISSEINDLLSRKEKDIKEEEILHIEDAVIKIRTAYEDAQENTKLYKAMKNDIDEQIENAKPLGRDVCVRILPQKDGKNTGELTVLFSQNSLGGPLESKRPRRRTENVGMLCPAVKGIRITSNAKNRKGVFINAGPENPLFAAGSQTGIEKAELNDSQTRLECQYDADGEKGTIIFELV